MIQWDGAEAVTISVFTAEGKEIRREILQPKDQISNLKPGIYFLQILDNSGHGSFVKVLIKK